MRIPVIKKEKIGYIEMPDSMGEDEAIMEVAELLEKNDFEDQVKWVKNDSWTYIILPPSMPGTEQMIEDTNGEES